MSEITYPPAVDSGQDTDLIERAAELRELLCSEAAPGEEQRNITDTAAAALRDAGMFRLGVPRRWGGYQASMRTILLTLAELGRGDVSASWVTMIVTDGALSASLLTDRAQEEIWGANPAATVTGVYTPAGSATQVDGGFVLTGKWPFNSGCLRADWTQVAFPVVDDGGNVIDLKLALIPYPDLTLEDTWFVAGMRGTASNTAVAQDVFVPEYRLISMLDMQSGISRSEHPDARETFKPTQAAEILALVGPLLGAGQAALDLARKSLDKGRPITGAFYQKASESPTYQLSYATAVSKVDTAFLHALRAADDVDRSVGQELPLDEVNRGRIRMDIAVALQSLREATALALSIGGAGSFADANPINRVWRDFETGSRHGYMNTNIGHECYARALLGLDPIAAF